MHYLISLLLFCSSLSATLDPEKGAVTYQLSGGRLGNNLTAYLHGKWIEWKYGIPLLYKPFPYAEGFAFHDQEKYLYDAHHALFPQCEDIPVNGLVNAANKLIFIPYFRDEGPRVGKKVCYFQPKWTHPRFQKLVRNLLSPSMPVETVHPPQNKLSVLLHIRTGGGFDNRSVQLQYPEKFPPHSFYVEALHRVYKYFGQRETYVYIMTDDQDPYGLATRLKENCRKCKKMEFDYRKQGNRHNQNVLEDFFTIPNFDCLIRADSTFSVIAALLGDFKCVVSPKRCHVSGNQIIVDEIDFKTKAFQ